MDGALIRKFKKGDHSAFGAIYNELKDGIYHFSLSYLRKPADAEEVVQEVFVRLWENRSRINPTGNLKAYTYKIARNFVFDTLRSKDFQSGLLISGEPEPNERAISADQEMVYHEYMEVLSMAIDSLPPRRKEIYCLSREKNLSYREISGQTGISVKMVEKHISGALSHIRNQMLNHAELSISLLGFCCFF